MTRSPTDVITDAWLLATQIAGQYEREGKKYDHLAQLAIELKELLDDWPPRRDPRTDARRGLLAFTQRRC